MPSLSIRLRYFCCLGLLFFSFSIGSAESKPKRVYKVGVEDVDYYPMFTEQKDRANPGFLIEVMELFAQQEQIEFEYIYLPITRFGLWYERDGIDLRIPDHPLWHQKDIGLMFSQDIIELGSATAVLKQDELKSIEDFKAIGSIYGFTPSPVWREMIESKRIDYVYASSIKILVRLLKQGHIDGLDINLSVLHHYATEMGYDPNDFVEAKKVPEVSFSYTLSTLAYPDVVKQFDAFLVDSQDKIKALREKNNLSP